MQHLPSSSLLLEIIHIRRGDRPSHNFQPSNGSHVTPCIVFDEKCQALHTLEFYVVQINCIGYFLKVAGGERDGLCRVDIFNVLQDGLK